MNAQAISITELSPAEKLKLVEDLWDDLATTPESIPVHAWHKKELAQRKANLIRDATTAISWEDIKQRIKTRNAR